MKYRKKPVVIEAIQWIGTKENIAEVLRFVPNPILLPSIKEKGQWELRIKTLEGIMKADIGDWIIKGVKGEFYPCKPDIFEQTYEPADD